MAENIPCIRCGGDHEDTLGDAICCSCRRPEEFPGATKTTPVSPSKSSGLLKWQAPDGEAPDGDMLVLVKTNKGVDKALVFVDEDGQTLRELGYGDVWTDWRWEDVSLFVLLDEILPAL